MLYYCWDKHTRIHWYMTNTFVQSIFFIYYDVLPCHGFNISGHNIARNTVINQIVMDYSEFRNTKLNISNSQFTIYVSHPKRIKHFSIALEVFGMSLNQQTLKPLSSFANFIVSNLT